MSKKNTVKAGNTNAAETYFEAGRVCAEAVQSFKRKLLYWSYRPVKYQIYPPFASLRETIDQSLARLFEGELDEGNEDVLDNMICDIARQAYSDLERQKAEHEDMIRTLCAKAEQDKAMFEREFSHLQEDLDRNRKEQETLRELRRQDEYGSASGTP